MAKRNSKIPPDLAWTVADQIGHAYSRVLAVSHAGLAHANITTAEFVALAILTMFPDGLSQTTWGQHQGVSRQRAHTIGRRLSTAKLVCLQRHGRSSTVTLSRRGQAIVDRLRPSLSADFACEMARLSTSEASELSRLLAKLVGAADV
jgi:DNA-binding MarR family transcriptional regulator